MSPLIAIIVTNFNGKELLEVCLSSLFKQSYKNLKAILVDNNSTDNSVIFVKNRFPRLDVINLDKNYGFSAGNNIGIKYALEKYNADYILLLNNDTKFTKDDTIERLLEVAQKDKKTGILGCKLIYPDGKIQYVGTEGVKDKIRWIPPSTEITNEPYEVYSVLGAAFLIKRSLIDRIGLLDEGFYPYYHEETDYCFRARKSGYLVKMTQSTEIIHYLAQTTKKAPNCSYRAWHRNFIRYMFLNLSAVRIFQEFCYVLKCLFVIIFEKKDKSARLIPGHIGTKKCRKEILADFLDPYLDNMKNLREIISKRMNRTKKLWF
jgi:hypothetical protein